MRGTIEERFVKFIEPISESGCHIWTGALFVGRGYGAFRTGKKQQRAHRVSWELAYGEIPDGMQVLHKCDVRCCVNPKHLFLGTQLDNMHDMINKGRKVSSPGEQNGTAKLNEKQVRAILSETRRSQRDIAAEYGVTQAAISLIKRGVNWPHLQIGRNE